MSQKKDLEKIFDELKEYIRETLEVIHTHYRLINSRQTIEEVYEILSEEFNWRDADVSSLVKKIYDETEITFDEFENICSFLGYTLERVLELAVFSRNNEEKSEKEVNKEILDEIEYDFWRHKQGSGE